MASPAQGPPPIPTKKTSPVVWIIVGLLGLVAVAGVVIIAGGLFLVNKARENPALAAARLMSAANPDVEIVSSDDSKATVTLKDKKSGKVVTLNFDELQRGKVLFEEDGKRVVIDGSSGNVNVKNEDGSTVRIGEGASANLPAWIPAYPGTTARATFSIQGGADASAAVSFATKDPVDKVARFYEDAFKKAGLASNSSMFNQHGKPSGGTVTGESADDTKNAVVNLATGEEGVTVAITYSDKKKE